MVNPIMVFKVITFVNGLPSIFLQRSRHYDEPQPAKGKTAKDGDSSMSSFRESLKKENFSEWARTIIMSSWRDSTKLQYESYIKKWEKFTAEREIDFATPSVRDIIEFLTDIFNTGVGYSAINTARSALSTFISIQGFTAGNHPLVKRFAKGAFNLRPALPRNLVTWDTNLVLKYITTLAPVRRIGLKDLTLKLTIMLALLSGQRCQTLHLIRIPNITLTQNSVKIRITDLLKQTRPGHHLQEISIKAYAPDRRLCIVTVLQEYIKRTATLRRNDNLFISYVPPHKQVSKATIGRWIKYVLTKSGVDVSIFTPHSTRAAATTGAKLMNVPIATIIKTAGWSNETTFSKYYDKTPGKEVDFAHALLQRTQK